MSYGHSQERALLCVLSEPTLSLSPLFRCLLIDQVKGKLALYFSEHFFNAVLNYVPEQSEYDAAWGDTIPPDFRSEAPKAYVRIFSPVEER